MTQTSPIGNRVRGQRNEQTMQATETALDKPKRIPSSPLLNSIARDALAAVFRDDSEAIANLPTAVTFRAFVVKSNRRIGCWRLIITTKAHGAWGHCMSAPIANREWVAALAEMINGPVVAPAPVATPNHTNSAEPTPSVHTVSTRCADRLGVLATRFAALFVQRTVRAPQPSAAAEPQTAPVQNANSQSKANTAVGSLNCASLPTAS